MYAIVKNPTITETISLHRLRWFGHVQRMKENIIPKRVLYMNLETRPRVGIRNRWKYEVREGGRIAGKGIKQRVIKEAPENGKNSSHSAHVSGINEQLSTSLPENPVDIGR
jgi:hypothetical protein